MPKASEVKKNTAIEFNDGVYVIRDIERSVPQGRAGGSLYRMRIYDVVSGQKVDHTFKDSDMLKLADLVRQQVMFSYLDGDECVFMDNEDFTLFHLNKEAIADEMLCVNENTLGIQIVLVDGMPVGIDLPASVDLVITETAPSIKGASASARNKPAVLTTGLTVHVPEYIASGDKIKVNTTDHKFMGKADSK
ncbi:MAG: elongation factor P [Phenylobacterium sp.]|jgi:elongation factor P